MCIKPLIVTAGEPAGIGPEIISKIIQQEKFAIPLVIAADQSSISTALPSYSPNKTQPVSLLHVPLAIPVKPGKPNSANNPAVFEMLDRAIDGCLTKEFSAMVTGPVNKSVLQFKGHTEYLAERCQVDKTVMLFTLNDLRVALLTTHVPLAEVPGLVTAENLTSTLRILQNDLRRFFNIQTPRILVLGLNPHAGEFGTEEQAIISPVISKLNEQGFNLIGPVAADTVFQKIKREPVDATLSLYHDQSLPVLKSLGFGNLVNVTLGLPIIRTSVDHGTAFDIAGTGKADESSLLSAIQLAIKLAQNHDT